MKDQRKSEIKVGITLVVSLILFIWILSWAKSFSLSSNEKVLNVQFDNVAGLEVGDQVTVNGVRKGAVEDFDIDGNKAIVKLSLEPDVKLKKDALFAIYMLDLMGGKKVEINPGTSSEPLDYNKTQNGIFNADIPSAMALVGSMQNDLVESLKDLRITLTSINKYLTDEELQHNIKTSMSNLSIVSSKLNSMIDENRTSIKQLTQNSVELTDEFKTFMKDNKDDISGSLKDLRTIAQKTDSLLSKANSFTDEIKNQQNALGKLMYDDEMVADLKASIKRLSELTKIILQQITDDGVKVDVKIF
ncbi:MAG: MlaD family protein [Ignavibacteriaceae bacterium]|nr:MlaD family protein [Ignavibacteriaceae bacterium]